MTLVSRTRKILELSKAKQVCLNKSKVNEYDLPTTKVTSTSEGDKNCNTSDTKLTTVMDVNTPVSKKKKKKYNAETSLLANSEQMTPVIKKSKYNLDLDSSKKESGVTPKSSKVFDEDNSWDDPLKPGGTKIVIPNKDYKGSLKLSEPASLALNGMVTRSKSYTFTFLTKAMSKSVDGKKRKKDNNHSGKSKCMSEPRQKKVNIVLTQNKSQDIPSYLQSVKNSPLTPHDPHKKPGKGVLKKRVSLESEARLNPVQLNTQLNGRSQAAKVLVGKKRKLAMEGTSTNQEEEEVFNERRELEVENVVFSLPPSPLKTRIQVGNQVIESIDSVQISTVKNVVKNVTTDKKGRTLFNNSMKRSLLELYIKLAANPLATGKAAMSRECINIWENESIDMGGDQIKLKHLAFSYGTLGDILYRRGKGGHTAGLSYPIFKV